MSRSCETLARTKGSKGGTYLAPLVVDHDVRRLHIPMDDTVRVDKVEGGKQLEHVVPDVGVRKPRV